jgi:hypothetical protein
MTKKIIDALSAVSVAIFLGIAIEAALWGESPRLPGHLSIESKIILWDMPTFLFGFIWLLVRYAETLQDTFQSVFGSWWKFAFAVCVLALSFFLHNIPSTPLLR